MRQLEAVIFDMDGVLIDSEPIHYIIERELFTKLGLKVSHEIHATYLGTAGDYMYGDVKARFGLSQSIEELLEFDDLFRCDYFKRLDGIVLNEGVLNLIEELKLTGIKLAVATSSSFKLANVLLDRCGILPFFDAVVTTSEAGKSKPFPEVYLMAAQKIGVSPEHCLVFEDSPNGLSAGKNAGMFCVAVRTDHVNVAELQKADFLLDTFQGVNHDQIFQIYSDNYAVK